MGRCGALFFHSRDPSLFFRLRPATLVPLHSPHTQPHNGSVSDRLCRRGAARSVRAQNRRPRGQQGGERGGAQRTRAAPRARFQPADPSLCSLPLSAARLAPAPRRAAAAPLPRRSAPAPPLAGKDLDTILADFAKDFEAYPSDKKVAVAGWAAAGLGAFVFAEKLMHTVVLDVLLGFPIQMVGLLALPGLAMKVLDGKDLVEEGGAYLSAIAKRLPGLDK